MAVCVCACVCVWAWIFNGSTQAVQLAAANSPLAVLKSWSQAKFSACPSAYVYRGHVNLSVTSLRSAAATLNHSRSIIHCSTQRTHSATFRNSLTSFDIWHRFKCYTHILCCGLDHRPIACDLAAFITCAFPEGTAMQISFRRAQMKTELCEQNRSRVIVMGKDHAVGPTSTSLQYLVAFWVGLLLHAASYFFIKVLFTCT